MTNWITRDSGKREEYATGARRDIRTGKGRYDLLPPFAIHRVAGVYERGAAKYGDRNYEKGIPLTRYLDSALRHTFETLAGKTDEDHAAQAAWNLLAFLQTQEMINSGLLPQDLNDLPNYTPEASSKEICQHDGCTDNSDCCRAPSVEDDRDTGGTMGTTGTGGTIRFTATSAPGDNAIYIRRDDDTGGGCSGDCVPSADPAENLVNFIHYLMHEESIQGTVDDDDLIREYAQEFLKG